MSNCLKRDTSWYKKNWRGITPLPVARISFAKWYGTGWKISFMSWTGRLWSNRSYTDHFTALKIIVEKTVEWQPSLHINFTDFEKKVWQCRQMERSKTRMKKLECNGRNWNKAKKEDKNSLNQKMENDYRILVLHKKWSWQT